MVLSTRSVVGAPLVTGTRFLAVPGPFMARSRKPRRSAPLHVGRITDRLPPSGSEPRQPPPAFSLDGWTVTGADGEVVGIVDQLVIGPQAGRSRYMVVRLDDRWLAADGHPRQVIVPLGCTQIVPGRREITLRALGAAACVRMPRYIAGPISEDDETVIWSAYALAGTSPGWDAPSPAGTPRVGLDRDEATRV
jgi:hypothetical protein